MPSTTMDSNTAMTLYTSTSAPTALSSYNIPLNLQKLPPSLLKWLSVNLQELPQSLQKGLLKLPLHESSTSATFPVTTFKVFITSMERTGAPTMASSTLKPSLDSTVAASTLESTTMRIDTTTTSTDDENETTTVQVSTLEDT